MFVAIKLFAANSLINTTGYFEVFERCPYKGTLHENTKSKWAESCSESCTSSPMTGIFNMLSTAPYRIQGHCWPIEKFWILQGALQSKAMNNAQGYTGEFAFLPTAYSVFLGLSITIPI